MSLIIKTSSGRKILRLRGKDVEEATPYTSASALGKEAPLTEVEKLKKLGLVVPVIALDGSDVPKKAMKGIHIPKIKIPREDIAMPEYDISKVNITYPLIADKILTANKLTTDKTKQENGRVYAYSHIYWDSNLGELVYDVIEPSLSPEEERFLGIIKNYIEEKIEISFPKTNINQAADYMKDLLSDALRYFRFKLSPDAVERIRYYVIRDFVGLGIIEPLIKDKNIEDISCDGVGIPIYVYHRNPYFGSIRTNIFFKNIDKLDSFVNKISEKCGKTITLAKPLLDGTLPDGSRVQATLGSDIASQGSNFTIRMFLEKPIAPTDVIRYNTADIDMLVYFWFLIEQGVSILIAGGTASGKTSFLNALSLFIKPSMKIVSIEDTAEIKLYHPHWVPEVARTSISEEGKVDMFALLKASLRQRPDYIIVGEVRGKEAYVLFQQMAMGNKGLSTIHAENFPKLVDRLTTPPISLHASLVENLDVIVFMRRFKSGNKYIRRISEVVEVVGYDIQAGSPIVNTLFSWNSQTDTYDINNRSVLLAKIADATGKDEKLLKEEILKRAKILWWMTKKGVTDYNQFCKLLNVFYASPENFLNTVEAEI